MKKMTEVRKKFVVAFILLIGFWIWSFIMMIRSFNTNETWRIVLSSASFLSVIILIVSLYRQRLKEEKKSRDEELKE